MKNEEEADIILDTAEPTVQEKQENSTLFFGHNFFRQYPAKILGTPYEASGRFGPVTKYKGDINAVSQIDVLLDFIGNKKELIDPLLSTNTDINLASAAMQPDVDAFISRVNKQSKEAVKDTLVKRQKKNKPAVNDDATLTPDLPELWSFEQIYEKYNPEISEDELEVFLWYKTDIGKPLSSRWARLVNKDVYDHPLPTASPYTVSEEKMASWIKKGLIFYYNAKFLPAFLYLSGDVYEKKFQLERDKEHITAIYGEDIFTQQQTRLNDAFREKYANRLIIAGMDSDEGLVILPTSKFAQEFEIERLDSMAEDQSFKTAVTKGRPDWAKESEGRGRISSREEFKTLDLKEAFSYFLINVRPELKEDVNHLEIIKHYVNGSAMRSRLGENASDQARKAEQAQFAKTKASLQKEGERLFNLFLNTELTLNDKVRLETEWNAKYNNYLPVNYNKVPVAFTMAKYHGGRLGELRGEKREAVAQALTNGTLCLAFDVGVGKTPSSIFIISAFLDAGYSKRPFICVPNQVYKQFISEIKSFAPHIPVLEAYNLGESFIENFKDANGKIAPTPAGCITMMTYEGLERIGFSESTSNELEAELYEILNQGGESERKLSKKQTQGFLERLGTLLGRGLRGSLYDIEDFGFDFACYDEAHKLKKIFTAVKGEVETDEKGKSTRQKNPYVINSGSPSSIGLKAFMLNHYILKRNDYQNILLLTATPFTNSPLEIFSMLSMLAYAQLQHTDLNNIKNFFDTYIKTSTELVINPKLKPEFKQVILGFNNLLSLQILIRRYINYKTGEDVNVVRPNKYILPYVRKDINGTVVELDENERVETYISMTPQQAAMMADVVAYVEGKISLNQLGGAFHSTEADTAIDEEEGADNSEGEEIDEDVLDDEEKKGVRTLRGMNFARNLALSPYLYEFADMGEPDYRSFVESSPKLTYAMECVRSVKEYHEAKGEPVSGQVIYMDRGVQYFNLLKEYLIEEIGYKPHEVGIIKSGLPAGSKKNSKEFVKNLFNGQIYNETTKLFDNVPDEERIKVILGSSTIKEGINLQKFSSCLYNCWPDWNPTDFQQLAGRIWRQGNLFSSVRIVIPLVVDSMDVFIFQKLQEKTSRLNTIWATDGKRNVLKLDEFNPEELKYALIRDPNTVAELRIIEDAAKIDSQILGITRLKDRIAKIKEMAGIINRDLPDAIELAEKYRRFEKSDNKLQNAQRAVQAIQDVLKTQKDIHGLPMVNSYYARETGENAPTKYSEEDPLYKPYWFDEFNLAQRNLNREVREFIAPLGLAWSLDDLRAFDTYETQQIGRVAQLEAEKTSLNAADNIQRIVREVKEERKAKKIQYKNVPGVVKDFARLNHLLNDRKIDVVPLAPAFNSCPPMVNGQRAITDEALQYIEACVAREPDTKSQNTTSAGEYKPERQQLHNEIIEHEFKNVRCVKQEKPIAVFTGGVPGSGKTTFLKKHAEYLLAPEVFHLDADAIREALPENKGWNVNSTHKESQDIINKLISVIGEGKCRYDFIYDGTMNKANKYFSLINRAKEMGYETYILFMVVPYGVARTRVLQRYQKTGRFVPMAVLDEFFEMLPSGKTRGEDALDQLKPVVDGYMVVDGVTGKIIQQGGKDLPESRNYDGFFKAGKKGAAEKELEQPAGKAPVAEAKAGPSLSKKRVAQNQIKALHVSIKYLSGEKRNKAESLMKSLKISLKYL
jgi:predicted ABC-type ATPase